MPDGAVGAVGVVEVLVEQLDELAALDGEAAAAGQAERVGERGPVEGRGHAGPPVDDDGVAARRPPRGGARCTSAPPSSSSMRPKHSGAADVEGGPVAPHGVLDGGVVEVGAGRQLEAVDQAGGRGLHHRQVVVGAVEVLLLGGEVGMHVLLPETAGRRYRRRAGQALGASTMPGLAWSCTCVYDHASWQRPRSASSGRRASPAPSSCACAPRTPSSRWWWPPATPRPARRSPTLYPSLAAAYPDLVFAPYDPADVRRARPRVLRPAPRQRPRRSCPSSSAGCGAHRRPRRRLPAEGRRALPAVVRRGAPPPRAAGRVAYGLPELFRDEIVGATPGRRARLLRRPPPSLALRPARAAGLIEPTGIIVDAASRRVRCRPAPQAEHDLLHRRRGLHRLRPARPPPHARDRAGHRRPGAVHAAPGADEPGHPRHLLRPPGRSRRPPTTCWRRCTTAYDDEPFVVVSERLAVDQGHARLQQRPRHRPRRPAHRLGRGDRRHRQPREGRVGPGACSAPTSSSACPRRPACPLVGMYP